MKYFVFMKRSYYKSRTVEIAASFVSIIPGLIPRNDGWGEDIKVFFADAVDTFVLLLPAPRILQSPLVISE